jgi:HK97 family phage major capsid protein
MNFLEQLQAARERRADLLPRMRAAVDGAALDALEFELRKVNGEIAVLEGLIAGQGDGGAGDDPSIRSNNPTPPANPQLNPLASIRGAGNPTQTTEEDIYSSMEYRVAFRNYMVSGTPIPEKFKPVEQRADALTTVGDIGAVIPTNLQNRVIEELTVEGKLLSRITQTSFQGGMEIPISEIKPVATWLNSEEEVSDEQKAEMKAKLTFSYHVLEAKVSVGLLSATIALPMFENTMVKQLKKSMITTLETDMVTGNGVGRLFGFAKYDLPTEQIITFTTAQIDTVKGWARAEAAIPEAYEDGEIYIMNKQTWEMHLNGMTDTTGQRIGLGKINEKGQKILNGREVLTLDKFPGFTAASTGDVFGVLINLEDYILNSNLNMYYKKYFNEDKNKWIHKALLIADGKMAIGKITEGADTRLVGAKGLIYLKKA